MPHPTYSIIHQLLRLQLFQPPLPLHMLILLALGGARSRIAPRHQRLRAWHLPISTATCSLALASQRLTSLVTLRLRPCWRHVSMLPLILYQMGRLQVFRSCRGFNGDHMFVVFFNFPRAFGHVSSLGYGILLRSCFPVLVSRVKYQAFFVRLLHLPFFRAAATTLLPTHLPPTWLPHTPTSKRLGETVRGTCAGVHLSARSTAG